MNGIIEIGGPARTPVMRQSRSYTERLIGKRAYDKRGDFARAVAAGASLSDA